MGFPRYILITPARNEAQYIEKTIKAVAAQTLLPERWVIVSDGSTDGTNDIVADYMPRVPYLSLLQLPELSDRSFASKVHAFNKGLALIHDLDYDYVGNLDADVSFAPDYYEQILLRFQDDPQLGLAGGALYDHDGGTLICQNASPNSVGGPIQLFSRSCFEAIGGYRPMPRGGIDTVAEVMARKCGFKVSTFPEIEVTHHRRQGSAKGNRFKSAFLSGIKFRALGYHPVFLLARSISRAKRTPVVLGGILNACGYFWALVRRTSIDMPTDVVDFLRREQMSRLGGGFLNRRTS